jgi:pimeloyl-ACP methyl ester carboxylesterase
MRQTLRIAGVAAPLFFAFGCPAAVDTSIEGVWEGELPITPASLTAPGGDSTRVILHLSHIPGGWRATWDSVDQNAFGLPVDYVSLVDKTLSFEITRVVARYRGVLSGGVFKGTWTQGPLQVPLDLRRSDHPFDASHRRPQEPARPFPYDESEVTVRNATARVSIACSLTRPRLSGRLASAVLLTGSGPQDRDYAAYGHRPFLVLSDALTRKGIAVLRCDDRGVGKSGGSLQNENTLDLVGDALAAVGHLRALPDIDVAHVGLIGHSEGAVIAAMAAAQSQDVRFIVMLGGPGLPGEELAYLQGALIGKAAGKSRTQIDRELGFAREVNAIVKENSDDRAAGDKIGPLYKSSIPPDVWQKSPEFWENQLRGQLAAVLNPWYRTFITLDPRVYLRKVTVPVLAINGERDLQVPPEENLTEIAQALKTNPDVTTRVVPGLNHILQTCRTGAPWEYGRIEETMSPVALDLISNWVVRHAREGAAARPSISNDSGSRATGAW